MRVAGIADTVRRPAAMRGVTVRPLTEPEVDGVPARSAAVEMEVAPGVRIPPHPHGDAELVVYVVAGRGRVLGGDDQRPVALGATVQVAQGERFGIENVGGGALVLVLVFTPGDFARRFSAPEAGGSRAAAVT